MKPGDEQPAQEWLPIGGLEPGFDEHKPPATEALAGKQFDLHSDADGRTVRYVFKDGRSLTWEVLQGAESGTSGQETYEAIRVAPEIFFLDFVRQRPPRQSFTFALDFSSMRATAVIGTLVEEGGRYRVKQDFVHSSINPSSSQACAKPHERSRDLVGKRIKYTYSSMHAYEHVYLNEHRYTWHCLSGPEKGLADTEHCTCFKIAPDIYLFTWWERVVPCHAVVMVHLKEMRSTGKLFGLDTDNGKIINFTMGAYAELLNVTAHSRAHT